MSSRGIMEKDIYVWGKQEIEDVRSNIHKVNIKGTAVEVIGENKKDVDIDHKAIVFHIGDGYLVGVTHALVPPSTVKYRSGGFIFYVARTKIDYKAYIDDRVLEYVGSHDDITLLRDKNMIGKAGLKVDYKNEYLYVGKRIGIYGFSGAQCFNFKEGLVSNLDKKTWKEVSEDTEGGLLVYMVSTPVNPGDSGAPVLTRDNEGNIIVVGVTQGFILMGNSMAFAILPSSLKVALDDIMYSPTEEEE